MIEQTCIRALDLTSPRLRGEVGAKRRVRGSLETDSWREPLTPTLSPQKSGERERCASCGGR
jgi:hypothetical protein